MEVLFFYGNDFGCFLSLIEMNTKRAELVERASKIQEENRIVNKGAVNVL